ncbi:MAG: DUF1109 domain-containing protein [Rhodospirillales bacterium]|nr:DUF1109 domain-containing protein [Alphaproteobacteria bacterium]MCB9986642.1 DUF1109 domain-containing protein [Rhodospirillales bacterium]USO06830.1 MAG: DUF1109 domain-containing protein [Rhodospirillales bacterium]
MRTDDLIGILAKAPPAPRARRNAAIWAGIALLFVCMAALVAATLGLRPGLGGMARNPHMLFKYAFLAALVVGSGLAWWRDGHPGRTYRFARAGMIFMAALLAVMVVFSFHTLGPRGVAAAVFQRNAWACIGFVALYTVVGSAVLSALTRCMAPLHARRHAALTMLFAAALGGLAYGLHCPHDNPVYFALWYGGTCAALMIPGVRMLAARQAW